MSKVEKRTGSCHCGNVKYEVEIDASKGSRCNCTICTKTAQLGTVVKPPALHVTAGEDKLSSYSWGGNVGKRFFCSTCGIHVFGKGHLAELGGDFVSVNLNTLDGLDPAEVSVTYWDGRHDNWMAGDRDKPWPVHAEAG